MTCQCTSAPITQTAQEVLNYEIDWAARSLGTDTIASSAFTVSSGTVVLSNESFTDTTTTFFLTGGIPGQAYTITNTVTTAGGLTLQETVIYVCIANRFI